MTPTRITTSLGAAALAAALAFGGAPLGNAATVKPFGTVETLTDANGAVVTAYTVTGLKASSDRIPWPVMGKLYEATVTATAQRGTVTPVIPMFNARAANGQTYRVLANVATPQGINPATLPQGAKSTGKIYFDVVGATPNSVVYNNGAEDLLIWVG